MRRGAVFSIRSDETPGEIVDGAGADPLARVRAGRYKDCFSRVRGLFTVCRMYTDTKGWYVTPFEADTHIYTADVGRKHGCKQVHPGNYDGEWLIVLEKEVFG